MVKTPLVCVSYTKRTLWSIGWLYQRKHIFALVLNISVFVGSHTNGLFTMCLSHPHQNHLPSPAVLRTTKVAWWGNPVLLEILLQVGIILGRIISPIQQGLGPQRLPRTNIWQKHQNCGVLLKVNSLVKGNRFVCYCM